MRKDELVAAVAKASKSTARQKKVPVPASSKNGKSKRVTHKQAVPVARNGTKEKSTSVQKSKVKDTISAAAKKAVQAKKAAKTQGRNTAKPPEPATSPKILKKIRELQIQKESVKDLTYQPTLVQRPGAAEVVRASEPLNDRIALLIRDPFWMHATWDITRNAMDRARAALAEQWHSARPVLRLVRVDGNGTTNTAETIERDIEIHGGLRDWYIEWNGEPASFRVLIGYLTPGGRMHVLAKSNTVTTPAAGNDVIDRHWSDLGFESERIYAMSGGYDGERETEELKQVLEDRLHRTLGTPALAQFGSGADAPFRKKDNFHFDLDVEMLIYGSTVRDGFVTIDGEPVTLRSDGTFSVRLPFPDRRQVLPAVACSRDGGLQRTIVVAVERNTKIMEPLESEQDTGE